jgi:phosphomannomutase
MKHEFNPLIFKAYDVRGKVPSQINEETAFFIGLCLAERVKSGTVCVGYDARSHSKLLQQNIIKGLVEMGINAVDLGLISTPLCYFSIPFLKADASIMVTGSHNPPEYNGFKITLKEESLSGKELFQFIETAANGIKISEKKGEVKTLDISEDYAKEALKGLHLSEANLKIGIDGMNGSGGSLLKKICSKLPFNFIFRNCEMTGDFSKTLPEPSSSENILNLQNFLKDEKLDLVFAFDGDADRVLLITPEKVWYGDDITLLLASGILKENKGRNVIFDVKSSIVLEKTIEALGGIPIIYKTGHSLIKQKMKEINAVLAGEMSGHIYINDGKFYPFDDGIYCFIRILEHIHKLEKMPIFETTFKTSEIKIPIQDRQEFLKAFREEILELKPTKMLEIDGIKAYFEEKSAILVRASNTEEIIIARVESYEESKFKELQTFLSNFVNKR